MDLRQTRNSLGFWLWPVSLVFIPWETFKLFAALTKIRLEQCIEYKRYNPLHILSPMPRQMALGDD